MEIGTVVLHRKKNVQWGVKLRNDGKIMLVIMTDSLDELSVKLERWKAELSAKGVKVNTKKTKIMISKPGAGPVQKTGKYPCSVCSKGVESNSIQCTKCKQWVHARCSRVKGKLAEVKRFCQQFMLKSTCEEEENIVIENSSWGCPAVLLPWWHVKRRRWGWYKLCAWKKFHELLPILSSRTFSLKKKGSFYQACVRSGKVAPHWDVHAVLDVTCHI